MTTQLGECRTCRYCKKWDRVSIDGIPQLFHYGIRHWAHAWCLVCAGKTSACVADHMRSMFDAAVLDGPPKIRVGMAIPSKRAK